MVGGSTRRLSLGFQRQCVRLKNQPRRLQGQFVTNRFQWPRVLFLKLRNWAGRGSRFLWLCFQMSSSERAFIRQDLGGTHARQRACDKHSTGPSSMQQAGVMEKQTRCRGKSMTPRGWPLARGCPLDEKARAGPETQGPR